MNPGAAPTKPGAPVRLPLKPGVLTSSGNLLTVTEPVTTGDGTSTATLSTSEAYVDSSVNRLVVTELIAAAAVLSAAAVLTLLATRSALRPLRHVGAVAQRIAAGDRRLRLHPRRQDTELGGMAASFDAMVDSLEEAVTSATRSEAAMRRFLADASHELRTPIAALQATAETLLREQPPRPRRDQLEAELARGTERLGRLVDDLLNLARLEANEPLRAEPVDLTRVSESLVAETRARTPASISIAHPGEAMVIGDPDALARALRNLLDNAVRAGGDGGTIRLELQRSPTAVRATVSDDGPGRAAGGPRSDLRGLRPPQRQLQRGDRAGTGHCPGHRPPASRERHLRRLRSGRALHAGAAGGGCQPSDAVTSSSRSSASWSPSSMPDCTWASRCSWRSWSTRRVSVVRPSVSVNVSVLSAAASGDGS